MHACPSETLRLFFALWPDDSTRTALAQLQGRMHGRLVPYGNLHLTLSFLGTQPASRLPLLTELMHQLPPALPMLTLDRVGYFPRKRIAWAGMHQVPETLRALHHALQQALRHEEISFDHQQNFKPHVTLARDASLPPDIDFNTIAWPANRIALVQSATQAGGSVYQVLASRSLEQPYRTRDEAGASAPDGE